MQIKGALTDESDIKEISNFLNVTSDDVLAYNNDVIDKNNKVKSLIQNLAKNPPVALDSSFVIETNTFSDFTKDVNGTSKDAEESTPVPPKEVRDPAPPQLFEFKPLVQKAAPEPQSFEIVEDHLDEEVWESKTGSPAHNNSTSAAQAKTAPTGASNATSQAQKASAPPAKPASLAAISTQPVNATQALASVLKAKITSPPANATTAA